MLRTERKPRCYYFGCWGEKGHFLFDDSGAKRIGHRDHCSPWQPEKIDGRLAPQNHQIPGRALMHKKDGFTAISFWDYSGDSRPGSNSTFIIEGDWYDFPGVVEIAKTRFPDIFIRLPYNIVEDYINE